jgi:hypothetical protein
MHLLGRTVETGMHDQRRLRLARLVHVVEVPGKRRLLVGNFDRFDQRLVQLGTTLLAIDGELVGACDPRILWIAVQEEL